jgi:acyl-CoA thioesterase
LPPSQLSTTLPKDTEMKLQLLLKEKSQLALTKAASITQEKTIEQASRMNRRRAREETVNLFFKTLKKTQNEQALKKEETTPSPCEYYTHTLNYLSEMMGLSVSNIENLAVILVMLIASINYCMG